MRQQRLHLEVILLSWSHSLNVEQFCEVYALAAIFHYHDLDCRSLLVMHAHFLHDQPVPKHTVNHHDHFCLDHNLDELETLDYLATVEVRILLHPVTGEGAVSSVRLRRT